MVPLADQPAEIGFCVFTKGKRVEITLRATRFRTCWPPAAVCPMRCARCGCTMAS
jgi:hypothetical protein